MLKFIGSMSLIWLVVVMSATAQNPAVLDAEGQPLQSEVEYYILSAVTDVAGGVTLVNRNGSCPFYVGQEPLSTVVSQGLPVTFTPYASGETVIREGNNFTVTLSAASICVQSTTWNLGEEDPETSRRLIVAGEGQRFSKYFMINRDGSLYNLAWCPADVCPICRFNCGTVGILTENDKGLLALDGSAFPFVFKRAQTVTRNAV